MPAPRITIVMATAAMLAASAGAQAQGRVAGRVLDQTGGVLPGVTIDLVVDATELTATTDAAGRYLFDGVPEGMAELTFRLLNFSVVRRAVRVTGEPAAAPDVVLTLSLHADVVVTGARTFRNMVEAENPSENLVGIAVSASQGAVSAAQLERRPMRRPGDVLETVPGMIVSQHSGEGKANQYYLRGFNLDHGTDLSTTVAGVPVNTPTGAHAHGYADTSFLIPELVSGVQFHKGPYFADQGDFSAAGAANINYVNQLEHPLLDVNAGDQGWSRVVGAASPRLGDGYVLGAIEMNQNDGPWVRPDGYEKVNGVLRYSRGDNRNGFSVTGTGYGPTGTRPIRWRRGPSAAA
jgi:outer membrane cobalamin receptor